MVVGSIDGVDGGVAVGWFYSLDPTAKPILLVDGHPAALIKYPIPRPDVSKALRTRQDCGFSFKVQSSDAESKFSLCTLVGKRFVVITERSFRANTSDYSSFESLLSAKKISLRKDAVAITCWDGGHNPIGRAKVLYDIASQRHPVVLFAYLFQEFGGRVWAPLLGADVNLVLIPWEKRDLYHRFIRLLGLNFDTVWMCKPRFPTFLLSSILSHFDSALVLDIDDNEAHFSMSAAAETKVYGAGAVGLGKILTSRVRSRTVASISIQKDFGGVIVRHARSPQNPIPRVKQGPTRLAFVGTVRPHKKISQLARAVRVASFLSNLDVELHVHGEIQPENLRTELLELGVQVGGSVKLDELPALLSKFDVLITGFAPQNSEETEITRYQISAKIGDALAVGRPVLVPRGPSVEDLENIPGVFLFDAANFAEKLRAAITYSKKIDLPNDFSLEGAYEAFSDARALAATSDSAGSVFYGIGKTYEPSDVVAPPLRKPALLLIWKQNDAGIYGRRIDQLARYYKRTHPDHDVIVLQFCQEVTLRNLTERSISYLSEAHIILESMTKCLKSGGLTESDIRYDVIGFSDPKDLKELFTEYMANRGFIPDNTVIVLFPVIPHFDTYSSLLANYKLIVDVVDNQFAWAKEERYPQTAAHYYGLNSIADAIVFNSENNLAYFKEHGLIPAKAKAKDILIQNWYASPARGASAHSACIVDVTKFNVVYSGNLNDRVDFGLMMQLLEIPDLHLHIFGTAERAPSGFKDLLRRPSVIYHGARPEAEVFAALSRMDLAIIPHVKDDVSQYMNPQKANMYKAAGLFCVATDVAGIEADKAVRNLNGSGHEFIGAVHAERQRWSKLSGQTPRGTHSVVAEEQALQYMALINKVRAMTSKVESGDSPEPAAADQLDQRKTG